MKHIKIFFYNNHTNFDIPKKINTYPVDVIFGNTMSEVKAIINNCQLYVVYTHLADCDIAVPTQQDKDFIQGILNFTKRKEIVAVKDSIWYSENADRNIIISDTCDFLLADITAILTTYLHKVDEFNKKNIKPVEMYSVQNTRNGEIIIKTPNKEEAIKVCDKSPCCVIRTRDNNIVYKSRFGKVDLATSTRILKARHSQSNGVFSITIS